MAKEEVSSLTMQNNEGQLFPSLTDLLTEDTVVLNACVQDWKQAIAKAGEILVRTGAAEPRYVDAMIRFKEQFGPYIVIAPGIALPHARPEEGVKRPCLSLLTLKKPVEFGSEDNDPVKVVIAFGAVDDKQHVTALAQLARLLSNEEDIEKIKGAHRKEEILRVVSKYSGGS
jgi:mannitol/fructose-specific phosphotransferase system IIA component (Ntr-type)